MFAEVSRMTRSTLPMLEILELAARDQAQVHFYVYQRGAGEALGQDGKVCSQSEVGCTGEGNTSMFEENDLLFR